MKNYMVQLQDQFGSIIEKPYAVRWEPSKVSTDEVAAAAAAEFTCQSGRLPDGVFRNKYAGISAVLQVDDDAA